MPDLQSVLGPVVGVAGAALAAALAHSLASGSENGERAYSRTAVDLSAAFFGFELMRSSALPMQPIRLSSQSWFDFSQPSTRLAIAAVVLLLTLWIAKSRWDNPTIQKFIRRGGTAGIAAIVTALLATDGLSTNRRRADLTLATHEALASLCSGTDADGNRIASLLANLAALRGETPGPAEGLVAFSSEFTPRERRHTRWAERRIREGKRTQEPHPRTARAISIDDVCEAASLFQRIVQPRTGAV